MKKTNTFLFVLIIVKLCTVSALCSSGLFDDSFIYDTTAKFLYSDGINTKDDAKNYARLNAAVAHKKGKEALEESYKNGHIQSLKVSLIAPATACVHDVYMDKLARLHHKLTRLDFSDCTEVIDETLKRWSTRFPELTSLHLHGCNKIKDGAIIAFAKNRQELREVDLEDCLNITYASVIALAQNCQKLRKLNLSFCFEMTDEAIITLAQNCKGLQEVRLSACRNLSVAAVIALAENCKGLQVVGSTNFRITNATVIALTQNCKELQEVDLGGCANVTTHAENALTQKGIRVIRY